MERVGAQALRGDVSHAYGLSGPRGVGKRTAATRLAQTLNCVGERVPGGCGRCRACLLIDRGAHPDVALITRDLDKRDIAIEQVRDMLGDLSLRPVEGRWRVVIVDDASDLNDYGQDALLKTLEEPPRHAVLLLVTPVPEALHPTIASRLQPLPLRLVPAAEIAAGMAELGIRGGEEHAAAAGGRPGVAIALAREDAARAERKRLDAELYRVLGSRLTERFAWAAALADEPDPRRRVREIERRLVHWGDLIRDAAVAAQGGGSAVRPDRATDTAAVAGAVGPRALVDLALLVERMRRDVTEWNANARLMLELFALRAPYVAALGAAA
ncbi:MAG TPA: hypothetical protein VFM93_12015 [Candidatus Limnocylindria bacterium]|nr:hypothetical protein [Candidatus Limnocylindria bacterium]